MFLGLRASCSGILFRRVFFQGHPRQEALSSEREARAEQQKEAQAKIKELTDKTPT